MSTETRNKRTHITSLSMTKLADGLLDPKLVLAWLLTQLGAGAFWVGFLVPVREAGALLPQLVIAEPIRRMQLRKWAWIGGSIVQGLAALGIAVAALTLTGTSAGVVIIGLVAVLAIARSVSSVSYKDVLGKTVGKSGRGRVSGTAASLAAIGVFVFGALLLADIGDRFTIVVIALALAGGLWLLAGAVFTLLSEAPSTPTDNTETAVWKQYWTYLRTDPALQRLILTRGLLLATAIAPPYLLLLGQDANQSATIQIGALVLASSFATLVSGWIWGVLSDHSTAAVLTVSGLLAGSVLLLSVLMAGQGYLLVTWVLPVLLFVLLVAYQGVRIARTTHLVNIANENTRTGYTAISNTITGVILLATGALGALVPIVGVHGVIIGLAFMCGLGALVASRLQT